MNKTSIKKSHSLKAKLFAFMFVLAIILLGTVFIMIIAFGKSLNYKKELSKTLDFQAEILENDILKHYEALEGHGARLAISAAEVIYHIYDDPNFKIEDLNDDSNNIEKIQKNIFNLLKQRLEQAHCSGAFVLLNATVNTSTENYQTSKTCIYLQRSGYKNGNAEILLFRGIPDIAKANGVMPHRKWKLEVDSSKFPSYNDLENYKPGEEFTYITDVFEIPGMDEFAQIIGFPIILNNERIGYCGFEISESFFKTFHVLPSKEEQLISIFSPKNDQNIIYESGFSSGTSDGYYFNPENNLEIKENKTLNTYKGDKTTYVGISKDIDMNGFEKPYMISVLIPRQEYDLKYTRNIIQLVLIVALLLFFATTFSLIFSRRFLKPLLNGLAQLKESKNQDNKKTNIHEINDLIEYLAEEEKKEEQKKQELENKHKILQEQLKTLKDNKESLEEQLKSVQHQLNDLAKIKKDTIDEDDSDFFLSGISILTPREKQVFDLYVKGYSAKQIMEELNLTQNGLKYHNGNIYAKLGVESRKQLLFYISALSKNNENSD